MRWPKLHKWWWWIAAEITIFGLIIYAITFNWPGPNTTAQNGIHRELVGILAKDKALEAECKLNLVQAKGTAFYDVIAAQCQDVLFQTGWTKALLADS